MMAVPLINKYQLVAKKADFISSPDQSVEYSRQLFTSTLTMVVDGSTAIQTEENYCVYDHDETEQKKRSNEISSVVYSFLSNLTIFNDVHVTRLVYAGSKIKIPP